MRLLWLGVLGHGVAAVQFDPEVQDLFVEYAEQPLQKIKQVGPQRTPKAPVRQIAWADAPMPADRPFLHMIVAPNCGACQRLKASINDGSRVRTLLPQFHAVYLDGPGGMPWTDKWKELGSDDYIPQVYFYGSDGRHLNVINPTKEEWFSHSFQSEGHLADAMDETLRREDRIQAGEDYGVVTGYKKAPPAPPPPPPPPPPPAMNEFGCLEGWAGEDCDECEPGYTGDVCDQKVAPPQPTGHKKHTTCESCVAAGYGWSHKKGKCGGYANKDCGQEL